MKKVLFVLVLLTTFRANSQDIADVLAAGKGDASIYLGHYLQPVNKGLIYDLSNGWYHSGKVHKKFGFDITINASAALVPDDEKVFNFKNSDYDVLKLHSDLSSDNLPTAMGKPSTKRIDVVIPVEGSGVVLPSGVTANTAITSFETLDGIEDELPVSAVPAPMVQFGIGLPTKTDLKIRFIPNIGTEDVSFNLYGIGLQHDLLQHFKLKKMPIVAVSLFAAYTTSTTIYTPKDEIINGVEARNQKTTFKINSYTAQLLGNVNLKIVNFYGGLGYVAGTSSTQVEGNYTYTYQLQDVDNNIIPGASGEETLVDPIDIDYDVSGMKATLGMRINIAFFKIFADYSIQEYNTVNAGISFSFR